MKKFIIFALTFLSLAFIATVNPQISFAECRILVPPESCSGDFGGTLCPGTTTECCDNANECGPTEPVHYKCDPGLGCVQDPEGPYNTSGQCSDACTVQPSWSCETIETSTNVFPSETTKQCVKKAAGVGQYSDLATCANNCELKICGRGAYQGLRTYCSVVAIGRVIAPGYEGCRGGEFCVTDSPGGNTNEILCSDQTSINTALGCIPITTQGLTTFFLKWALGIGGGIAFLMIVAGGFIIMTSAGDPEKLQNGKQILTAAISGIVLIIFSVFILRIIGVNILGIF